MKLSLRAYLLARRVQRLGRWVSSFLAIVLTGKARVVLAITDCIFGAIWQIREICKPVSEPTRRHNMLFDFRTGTLFGCSFVMSLFTSHEDKKL